jgi:hypothetical protein
MRALAGPASLLVIVGGFLAWHMLSGEDSPDREFTGLELAGPGPDYQGTCYSLSTVFIANGIFGNVPRTWKKERDDAWTLTLERVAQGNGGPMREYASWTFEEHGDSLRLAQVAASKGFPQDIAGSIDQLLLAPNARRSTPVDRCLEQRGTGYGFTRK